MTVLVKDMFKTTFDSLEEFAETISIAIQCPVTIEDANHRLIAYSSHDEQTDSARISTIISRRVPEKVVNQLWKDGTIPSLLKTSDPVRVSCNHEIGLGDRVAISIRNQEELLGFIWALEVGKTLGDEDMRLLKSAAEAAKSKLLQLQIRKNKKEDRKQEFFWKLLTGHLKEEEEISENCKLLQLNSTTPFVIAAFDFGRNITSREEKRISYLLHTYSDIKPLLHTIDCHLLILLIATNQDNHQSDIAGRFYGSFAGKLASHIDERVSICPAFSSPYDDYRNTEKAYKEALAVLSIKEKFPFETGKIHSYQKLGIYQLMDIIMESRKHTGYENPSITKLEKYDKKNNTNLVETLEEFLTKDANVNDAARALNIHANTLNYRLKRISEIAQINFKDPNQKMLLYLDLKLAKF
ncbi:PucR family transcriptional regulator [Neobacillus notoginsengisoli]|uniref:PucR family transcriptional regulator n=1 Tax=Neobacillus notoginsengisoli TaxID=1578198 RepID=A0A417YLC4_9BACI|nr:PucR family transcriptional regulator [Neobacillus notoginsengisoli]RHW34172.1 PucR family transcriptional regulator [Neobacillus notoginsengisoli]